MDRLRRFGNYATPLLTTLILFSASASVALAAGGGFEAESENLVIRLIRWAQRIALSFVVLAFMEAGTRFFNPDTNQGARSHMMKVTVGSVVVIGAAGIAELLKASFSARI